MHVTGTITAFRYHKKQSLIALENESNQEIHWVRAASLPYHKGMQIEAELTPVSNGQYEAKTFSIQSPIQEWISHRFADQLSDAQREWLTHQSNQSLLTQFQDVHSHKPFDDIIHRKIKSFLQHRLYHHNMAHYFSMQHIPIKSKALHQVLDQFGSDALSQVQQNPYRLCELKQSLLTWQQIDGIGQAQHRLATSPERIEGAIHYTIHWAERQGSTYLSMNELIAVAHQLIGKTVLDRSSVQLHVQRILNQHHSTIGSNEQQTRVFRKSLFFAEHRLAKRLTAYLTAPKRMIDPSQVDQILQELAQSQHINSLDPEQRAFVHLALSAPISMLLGPAGTGKTETIKALLLTYQRLFPNEAIALHCPTGKGARVISEKTGHLAQTTHAFLKRTGDDQQKDHYQFETHPLNVSLSIMDESSMADTVLMSSLLYGADEKLTQLVFVGDPYQLEPVGAGRPFADLIVLGVPHVELKTVHRHGGALLDFAAATREGIWNPECLSDPQIEVIACESWPDVMSQVIAQKKAYNHAWIITPYREDAQLGIDHINEQLQEALNPKAKSFDGFRLGDPVIQLENNKERNVFNGEIGEVIGVNADQLMIRFPHQQIVYPADTWGQLELAYALTCHKAQGGEADLVILPLWDREKGKTMWHRHMIYTAITRAKKKLILIGDLTVLRHALTLTGNKRLTRLVSWTQRMLEEIGKKT